MAQLSPQTEQGYSPPTVRQFSVFLDNKVGKLLELLQMCEQNGLQIAAFSVLDSSDHAVVRMIFTNADAARHTLRKNQYTFSESDLLVVEMLRGQTVATVCLHLLA
ncbi:MAG: acetolactate synthase, partial [Planctomycetes bacterium]|nr:acetolactate synthase [Planctomycetota bacterium]